MKIHSGEFKDDGFIEAVGFEFILKHAQELWKVTNLPLFIYSMPSGNMVTVGSTSKFLENAKDDFMNRDNQKNWKLLGECDGVLHYTRPFRVSA